MSYNPDIHHRHSIRLKGYDYAQCGLYFITICVQGRDCLLGNVANGVMVPNDAGRMVADWYAELENKFPSVRCHAMVVMPNHFHCILEIVDGMGMGEYGNDDDISGMGDNAWAPQHKQPGNDIDISGMGANVDGTVLDEYGNDDETGMGAHVGAPLRGRPIECDGCPIEPRERPIESRERPNEFRERPENDDIMGIHIDETVLDGNVGCETMGTHVDDGTMGTHAGVPQRMPRRERIENDETVLGNPENETLLGTRVDETVGGTHVDETLGGTHVGVPLPTVVGWFKTMTTNAYIRGVKNDGWKPFYGKLWQRNYYEHIIRNEKSYHNISEYIVNNPSKWDADKLNPQN